jgi:hypothetical protein
MAARVASVPLVAAIVVVGVWVAGGLLSDDFRTSAALTALWFALAGIAAVAIGWRKPSIRWVVIGSYVATSLAVTAVLVYTTFRTVTVIEPVITTGVIANGSFVSREHATSGDVAFAGGGKVVTLRNLATSSGPDLRVILTVEPVGESGDLPQHVDLGGLKGNRGTQQYEIPADVDVARYRNVVIWCRAFSVAFGEATLS